MVIFIGQTEHNNKFYLAVCDSTGHGVPGAFMSLLNIGFLSEAIKEKNISLPNEIFNYVRKRLTESIGSDGQKDGMDAILICIEALTDNTKKITYAAANNEPILIKNNSIIKLAKDKMPVGQGELIADFTLHTIDYKTGDTLYLYTDGYADQFGGPKGKKFKYKALNDLLESIHHLLMQEQHHQLNQTIANWMGDLEQVDDICIVGIRL
ncbi:MAG: serine/threonine-protein phosphatase [Bacteroidetes bacterium]|nr:serine/threonine-protein phosphatase [Bacteroidota bacterium]